MNTYRIKYKYHTGDSYSSEDRVDYLDGEWKNVDILQENLKRIKDHYQWYLSKNGYGWRDEHKNQVRPEWHDGKYEASITLLTDEGKEYKLSAPWCGYFESLHWIEAEIKNFRIEF